jgi:hypothetical protein
MSLSFWGFVCVTLMMLTDLSEIRPILPQLLDGKLSIAKVVEASVIAFAVSKPLHKGSCMLMFCFVVR